MKLGTAEAILQCAPRVTGFDSRNLQAGETSAGSVNSISVNNSATLVEVQAELEQRVAHLVTGERQILKPVMNEYLDLFCNDRERERECCRAPPRGFMRLGQGTPCLLRKILTMYHAYIFMIEYEIFL